MSRQHALQVGIIVGLISFLLSGCADSPSEGSLEPCPVEGKPELSIGAFGPAVVPLGPRSELEVWEPLQGGVVVGLNVLATGVPRNSNPAAVKVVDTDSGQDLGTLASDAAFFRCSPDVRLRMWDRIMVQLEAGTQFDAGTFDARDVEVRVSAGFPNFDGAEPIFVTDVFDAVLRDRVPARERFEKRYNP